MNARPTGAWQTQLFGPADRRLLGCYHAPPNDRILGCGVVLVHSLGEEYIKFHRALRQLAVLLAEAGFSVLRFDLSCCGDSWGRSEDGNVDLWLEDIETAIAELRANSGVARLSLVGLRLGGSLAALSGNTRKDLDALVLWDPAVSGSEYLGELEQLHHDMLRYAHVIPDPDPDPETLKTSEILGFPVSSEMRESVSRIDLIAQSSPPARRILVVESNPQVAQAHFAERLQTLGGEVDLRQTHAPQLWSWLEDFSKVLVPQPILQTITDWMAEPYR